MESTTLVTFLFKTSRNVDSVQLFGSWDNFSNGYYMQRESYKGFGCWSACPKFDCIICDGVQLDYSRPRSGALKQGGRYWYYFKLDNEEDCYDPFKPNTSTCPLLPGQVVNVLDIPVEMVASPQLLSKTSVGWTGMVQTYQMTYDPADRHKKVLKKPSTRYSRSSCASDSMREKVHGQDLSIVNRGGPVQRQSRPCEVPLQRPGSSGRESMDRVEAPPAPYQKASSDSTGPTAADMDALIQSISTNVPEFGAGLRPFGPMLGHPSDERPVSRHGGAKNAPIGLGISIDGVGSFPLPPNMTLFNGELQEARRRTRPSSPLSGPNDTNARWTLSHPNPLGANLNSLVLPKPVHIFSEPGYDDFSFSPVSCVEEEEEEGQERGQDGDEDLNLHSDCPTLGAGPHDMASPTFTAATVSPLDECFNLAMDDDKDCEPSEITLYPDYVAYLEAEKTPPSEMTTSKSPTGLAVVTVVTTDAPVVDTNFAQLEHSSLWPKEFQ